ncbi:MAG: hypothetical protein QOJ09_1736 [Actinomycetota bacterium]|jgi:hypothetical protein|nr:hypothetical protein [Actinomycetota bacterium]
MGRASSSKKVARAASTGGGRTSRGRTPWVWYTVMTLVVILGVLGVAVSRSNLSQAAADPPAIGKDHWHAAYGINICGRWHAGLTDTKGDAVGIHSHGDGLIHIHPTSALSAGKNARLGLFMTEEGVKLTKTSIALPDRSKLSNGDKCGSKPGKLQVGVWETPSDTTVQIITSDPNKIRLKQAEVITIAFLPEGTKLQQPPSAGQVTKPSDVKSDLGATSVPSQATTPPPTAAGASTTAPAAGTATTSKP